MAGKIYYLKRDYFNKLTSDPEFELNINRPYYIVRNVPYKGDVISLAVPLRSNINKKFQSAPNEYISTPPTAHTLSGKGNIAGWHFTKAVPVTFENVYSSTPTDPDTIMALAIADTFKHDEFISKAKDLVKRIENGEDVFGAIDFDSALSKLTV